MLVCRIDMRGGIAWDIQWLAVAGYLTAAVLAATLASVSMPSAIVTKRGWWSLSTLMFFLGINKPLNLQTLLLEEGRRLAKWGHWYGYRRIVQLYFVFALLLLGAVLAWKLWRFYWQVVEQRIDIAAGLALIFGYCILRAAEIDHLKRAAVDNRFAHSSFWLMELAGISLVLVGTGRAALARLLWQRSP